MPWRIDSDALAWAGLRLALQRIAASHWQPQGVLRSWGLAPLFREGERLCVPCGPDEVLWLGAWRDDGPPSAPGPGCTVGLTDPVSGQGVAMDLAQAYALTALADRRPLALRPGETARAFLLALTWLGGLQRRLPLVLMAPAGWSALSGRPWAALPDQPPPPPRRLG